jgi:hypothetical protein
MEHRANECLSNLELTIKITKSLLLSLTVLESNMENLSNDNFCSVLFKSVP